MAKSRTSTTIIAVALFCLFALSFAGDATEKDESTTQVSLPLSEAAANPALRLPTDPVNTETESNSAVVASSMPLTKTRFRPVNRRFRVRSGHPCRHHFKFYPTTRVNGEVPYGNDMLVSTGEKSDFQEPILHGEGRRIRGRWVRMHHHHHHDEDSDSDDEDDDRLKKIVLQRYEKNSRKHFRSEEEKKKNGGFMKIVRKFLDHYF
ncbi:hypothetical protein ACS0TY_011692 [Phlomoides rotata]